MRLSLDTRYSSEYDGKVVTDFYINGRLVYSDVCPTPYQILSALCDNVSQLELDPLGVEAYSIHRDEVPVGV